MTTPPKSSSNAATYAERGMAVPFTTPKLSQARARLDYNGRFEFMVPNLSGGKGNYIMPWKTVLDTMSPTLHDRTLYDEMNRERAHDPYKMRMVGLRVATTGLAGPAAAKHARELLTEEQEYQLLTNFLLVIHLLGQVNLSTDDLLKTGLASESSQHRLKQSVIHVASKLKVPHSELYARIETLSSAICSIGLPTAPKGGRLRALTVDVDGFRNRVLEWLRDMPAEVVELGEYQASVAAYTHQLALSVVKEADQSVNELGSMISKWEETFPKLSATIGRLAWILDGWDFMVAMTKEAERRPSPERQAVLCDCFTRLPLPPEEETKNNSNMVPPDQLNTVQRRWVRANQDWRSGNMDYAAVKRIESVKAMMN
ncbi:conserved hypothetical protein [uncultured Gammaproteobacteria bacterium]